MDQIKAKKFLISKDESFFLELTQISEKLDKVLEALESLNSKEMPLPPEVQKVKLEGIDFAMVKGQQGDTGRSGIILSEQEPLDVKEGEIWVKP
ncbi:MAG: hypothetical protein ACHQUA_01885 [Microgenomates group bacterium]